MSVTRQSFVETQVIQHSFDGQRPTGQSAADYMTASCARLPWHISIDNDVVMNIKINRNSTLSLAYWCSTFCCTTAELIDAMDMMASDEVGVVGLFLATRSGTVSMMESRSFPTSVDEIFAPNARLKKVMDRGLLRH